MEGGPYLLAKGIAYAEGGPYLLAKGIAYAEGGPYLLAKGIAATSHSNALSTLTLPLQACNHSFTRAGGFTLLSYECMCGDSAQSSCSADVLCSTPVH